MSNVKLGIIGSGMIAHEHIRNIKHIDGVEVTAVADPDETMRNSAQALSGAQCVPFTNHTELLEKGDINALLISSPNYTHIDILKDVFRYRFTNFG